MCGITGIIAFNEGGAKHLSKISDATYSLYRRGPDGEGLYFDKNCALGHRRLSIIDTSNAAAQPFTDNTNRYTIVFNGEIFNYKELRKDLEQKGISFRSKSDTEVLLHLFILEKEDCLSKLDGEFAFAVYDKEKGSLFLARDRFGIKPLYYCLEEDRFIFASELKSIIAFGIKKEIDPASLQTYFHLNYIPSPYSIFKNVLKLEAGHFMKIEKEGKKTVSTYYSLPDLEDIKYVQDYSAAQIQLRESLERSVKNRMVSDVALGAFLSGGIDSSIITALAAKHTSKLNTFSIGYKDEPLFDETHFAEIVAKKHQTNHTVFALSNNDLYESLHTVLDYIDEPFADSSALAVNILSMHTRKHVTVALSGDGADELFAGYNKHAAELKIRQGSLKVGLVKKSHGLLKQLPKSRNTKIGNKIRQLEKFAEGSKLDQSERYWQWAKWSGFKADELFVSDNNSNEYEKRKKYILHYLSDDYNSVLKTDMSLVLENDMLVKVDRMSMNQSLEVRVPFLDHKVVDFAFGLPASFKIDRHRRKKILIETFSDELPTELLNRGKKGFEVPLLKWFRTDLYSMITNDLLADEFIKTQGIFNIDAIKKLKQQLLGKNPNDAVERVWALIVFQYWWKKHIQN